VGGVMRAFDLASGALKWQSDWKAAYDLPEAWFGVVSSPLVYGELLIQNLGQLDGGSVAAFDRQTGELAWKTGPGRAEFSAWGASCASPVLAKLGGRDKLFVITGGKSQPPQGGLMVLDPKTGALEFSHAFRSRTYYSVNGSSPVVAGDKVFLSASYGVGSVCLDLGKPLDSDSLYPAAVAWKDRRLGLQFGNAIEHDGTLYVANGSPRGAGSVSSYRMADGKQLSGLELGCKTVFKTSNGIENIESSCGEASLLLAEDHLYCLGDDGTLFLLDLRADKPRLVSSQLLFHARWAWTPPLIHQGLLFVRQTSEDDLTGSGRRLLCYDLRAPSAEPEARIER